MAENVPYDKLVEGIVTAVSRRPGQSYLDYCQADERACTATGSDKSYADLPSLTHYWARQDFRDPDARAIAFAYSFLGIRIQVRPMPQASVRPMVEGRFPPVQELLRGRGRRRAGRDPETRQQYEKIVKQLGSRRIRRAAICAASCRTAEGGQDRAVPRSVRDQGRRGPRRRTPTRTPAATVQPAASCWAATTSTWPSATTRGPVVMDWLRDPKNPLLRAGVCQSRLGGVLQRGHRQSAGRQQPGQPAEQRAAARTTWPGVSSPSGFDMKWVHRQIANSRTYQLSWQPNDTNRRDETNFSHAIPRRLPAEVVYDAMRQATASDEQAAQLQPDVSDRAIAIPGAGPRSNRGGNAAYALTIFGRSTRHSNCDCDRSTEASLLQTVYLQNDRERAADARESARTAGWRRLRPASAAAAGRPRRTAKRAGKDLHADRRRDSQAQPAEGGRTTEQAERSSSGWRS